MRRNRAVFYWLVPVSVLVCVLLAAAFVLRPASVAVSADTRSLPADGISVATVTAHSTSSPEKIEAHITEGSHRAEIIASRVVRGEKQFAVRAGTTPGPILIAVTAPGASNTVALAASLDSRDTAADGTPDFLRLDDSFDQRAFREWFTFLAEHEAFRPAAQLLPEINDCAALIRYAYRESLRTHDGTWAGDLRLHEVPGTASVRKYQFPYTALGASMFRIKPGIFSPADLDNGTFAQFADARVLQSFNTHFISRDVRRALPGDLLFFRQQDRRMPYHVMIFIGHSHLVDSPQGSSPASSQAHDDWLVYHTGPTGKLAGEIRRVTVTELMQHPDPRWRPWIDNPSFLGVYRWNILRDPND